MEPEFNLISEPWIPCIQEDGRVVEMGIRDTLVNSHNILSIQGESPLVTIALLRLLLAILHSSLNGPGNRKEWIKIWNNGTWIIDKIEDYLYRWENRFYLFHPVHPFYQEIDTRVNPKSITLLVHSLIVSDTLFDHESANKDVSYDIAKAARTLVAAQSFGLGGSCDPSQKLYYSDGTCARGIIFLLEGNTLFETLLLNLILYNQDSPQRVHSKPNDMPAWEMEDPYHPHREVPFGYLDYLTWQNRRIYLIPESSPNGIMVREVTISPGLRWDVSIRDPMKHYSKDKVKGYRYWYFSEGRALWRDSSTLFRLNDHNADPPENVQWIGTLVDSGIIDSTLVYRIVATGIASVPGQAKIKFYRQERLPLPLAYYKRMLNVEHLSIALELTEKISKALWSAINTLAEITISSKALDDNGRKPDKKDIANLINHWGVDRNYWGALEIPFYSLVESIPKDPEIALHEWRNELQRTAWDTFRQAERLAGNSPSALKAAVRASGQLAFGLKKLFPSS